MAVPRGAGARSASARHELLPAQLLTATLWLSLWLAVGSFVLAVASGLGPHPARRVLIGLVVVAATACALGRRAAMWAALRTRPWLVLPLAAAQLSAAAVDGLIGGPFRAFSMTSIALAVLVAWPRTVWLCVALLDLGYAIVVFSSHSPAELVRKGELDGVLGALLGYPFVALVLLGLARLFAGFMANVEPTLAAMRQGAPALTPSLTRAIQRRAGQPALALPYTPTVDLTPTELRVVEGLASGSAPKELAQRWGVSLATVRTHIKRAKRKTGARTLHELVAMVARDGERPDHGDDA